MEREIIALIASILLIVVLVRFRVDLGVSMLLGGASMALIAGKPIGWTGIEVGRAAVDVDTLWLLGRIVTIIALGALAGRLGYLDRLVSGLRKLISDNRVVIALIPAFGGLLPMPGGTMLTAPMVESATSGTDVTPEQKLFVSYWFRHVWEYIWPLYPGVVFAAALVERSESEIAFAHLPLTISAIVGGVVFTLMWLDAGKNERVASERAEGWRDLLIGVLPFGVVVAGVLVLKQEVVYVVLVVIALLSIIGRVKPRDLLHAFKRGTELQIITLVVGVAAYKHILTEAGVVAAVPPFFMQLGLPELVVIFAVPFMVGLVTGVTLAFVAVTFPLLLPLMGGADVDLQLVMFAYGAGFVGCLLSPVHLCLVLTREYFRADFGKAYRMLLLPCALIVAVATAIVLL
jgi:integral membrane protein (TIGR00529 family)